MESNQPVDEDRGPSLNQRLSGVAVVVAIYAVQWIVLTAILVPLQQSVLWMIISLIILGVGWLSSGFILGGLVLSRSSGGRRFAYGLTVALILSFLLVVSMIEFMHSLPPTYHGP